MQEVSASVQHMPVRSVDATPERWREIGHYLVARREWFEMDQKELVEVSEVSQSVVSKIENGRPDNNRVTVSVLRRLARALVMYPDAFVDMTTASDIGVVDARNVAWWHDLENAGGVEEFYEDRIGKTLDLGHRIARIELRLAAVEEHLGLEADAAIIPFRGPTPWYEDRQAAESGLPDEVGPKERRPRPEPEE